MASGSFGGRDGWNPSGQCTFFVCDIVSFTAHSRSDLAREHMRLALYAMLEDCFERADLPPGRCYHEDRGDGVMVVLPPELDSSRLVHPLIDLLRGRLLDYNDLASDVARIRLRTALHLGRAKSDGKGIVGADANHVFRLLDAPGFKAALKRSGSVLGVLASQALYDEVIRDARGLIDPDEFRPLPVANKETRATAWLRIPGEGHGGDGSQLVPADPPAAQEPRAEVRITVPGVGHGPSADLTMKELLDVVDRLLDIPLMVTAEGRDGVVESLRREIRIRVARRPQPHMDGMSIVRTCAQYPGGLLELAALVRAYAGDTPQVAALRETIARICGEH
ncbi:hypothetical protein SAMN04489712_12860 [Thermomonospora echinospora]|uniref:Effector-associated domain-containing protein n=1 Tax=Thermomonospora echinospora TaxID=1992 RepID=A0A1H6E1G5_9ACTN|nr:hypothetical protein [Thermomonospora echinospora]SEG91199.1 hypothetical protein SAMN04489712_12860 [Thermomonospora echinospora]